MTYRRINWPDRETLRRWYEDDGLSTLAIGRIVGAQPSGVLHHLAKLGVQIRTHVEAGRKARRAHMKRPDLLEPEKLKRLYVKRKLSITTIARMVGCGSSTVHRAITEARLVDAAFRINRLPSRAQRKLARRLEALELTPQYEYQVRWYRVDIAFPDAKLAVEVDGEDHQLSAAAQQADRIREEGLREEGWSVLRFPDEQIELRSKKCARKIQKKLEQLSRSCHLSDG